MTLEITEQVSSDTPSQIKHIQSNELDGFETFESHIPSPTSKEIEVASLTSQQDAPLAINPQRKQFVSIDMPLSSQEIQLQPLNHNSNKKKVFFDAETIMEDSVHPSGSANSEPTKQSNFHSQSMPPKRFSYQDGAHNQPKMKNLRDKRFDSLKTFSRGKQLVENAQDGNNIKRSIDRNLPVHRYFDALEGPELETLKSSEEITLPQDKNWPFLLRFPITTFGIGLGVSSQAILWKTLATSPSTEFLNLSPKINTILWYISMAIIAIIFIVYILKIFLYFEAVRREYYHPIRVNFFFAPWIALLFLALGVPPSVTENLHKSIWYILMVPIFFLELKIYGQWLSSGERRLSKVATPLNHLAIVGNFVGALLGSSMGLVEGPIFFFAIGLAHYIVLFVTLYQRLPTNETLPKELHPAFFLFVAAPSVASMAWARIQGSFDYGSRIAYFTAMFLYLSLAVRVNFFRGFKFSIAWWAYTFPMTGAAIATIRYSNEVTHIITKILCVALSLISTFTVLALLVSTILHAFVFRDLFPNDIAIAISHQERKPHKHWLGFIHGSQESKEIENYLKFMNTDDVSLNNSTTQLSSSNTDQNLPS